ncbi:FecR family protein [Sphingobacterium sp. SYP-B4668]|uniref:FecR family protein n=1 Tax=Sphingobacterium sp. SYP-B4668 TaxID=2996035 RepID=UPI0022DD5BB7|nr:FecR family protein [Sphingobacterium sp. SYP-B4668]
MDKRRFIELIGKVEQGLASKAERQELDDLYDTFEQEPGFTDLLTVEEKKQQAKMLFQKISSQANPEHLQRRKSYNRMTWSCAISAIFLLTFWWGYMLLFQGNPAQDTAVYSVNDALPAKDEAYLRLADGRSIILDNKASNKLDGLPFYLDSEGALVYQMSHKPFNGAINDYHTITTPKGGRYMVILPDGTKVWLNAGSSLTFPTVFATESRSVKMSGEVYFDVAKMRNKQKSIPFIVETPNQQIEVLGTQFNVTAYVGQKFEATTLIEGSVRVQDISKRQGIILVPGQQALFETGKINVYNVSLEKTTAWKNGMFRFENDNIRTVMQQLENWYDVDIDYSNMPMVHFNGGISRSLPLSNVLNMLEVTGGFRFEINAKNVKIITNQKITNP